jgi:DNA-binding GntR family transcriptional regulator
VRELSASAGVIAGKLRDQLLDGSLRPGDRLKEEELAERFRVGRYTVRSALRTLVAAGLLEHEANRGAEVPVLTRARVDELYEYRTILELGSLRAAQAHGTSLVPVARATAILDALPPDTGWPEVIGTHQEIHRAIVRLSGNSRLIAAYEVCEDELQFVIAMTRPAYTAQRLATLHVELLSKLEHGRQGAVTALADDIEIGRLAVHEAMDAE